MSYVLSVVLHAYLYDNNGGRGQYLCKVCDTTFNPKNYYQKSVVLRCPHCSKTLEKSRFVRISTFISVRMTTVLFTKIILNQWQNLKNKILRRICGKFKVRYIFRDFTFDFKPLSKESPIKSKVSLPNIMVFFLHLDLS